MSWAGTNARATYGLKETEVAFELRPIMLGRIIKFRRGDQYEEMQGRDEAGKTTDAGRSTTNVNSAGQRNQQPDAASDSTIATRDTTPEGTSFSVLLD